MPFLCFFLTRCLFLTQCLFLFAKIANLIPKMPFLPQIGNFVLKRLPFLIEISKSIIKKRRRGCIRILIWEYTWVAIAPGRFSIVTYAKRCRGQQLLAGVRDLSKKDRRFKNFEMYRSFAGTNFYSNFWNFIPIFGILLQILEFYSNFRNFIPNVFKKCSIANPALFVRATIFIH